MEFRLSKHAEWELRRRDIPLNLVEQTLAHPGERVVQSDGTEVYQSQFLAENGRYYH